MAGSFIDSRVDEDQLMVCIRLFPTRKTPVSPLLAYGFWRITGGHSGVSVAGEAYSLDVKRK
jgi:hypothetical protein